MANNKNMFVNVDFSKDPELLDVLEDMVKEDDLDRSKFIRKLIRQEQGRRQQLPLPFSKDAPAVQSGSRRASKSVAA